MEPAITATLFTLVLALAGCADMSDDTYVGDADQSFSHSDLESRPSLDEAISRYELLLREILGVVTATLPDAEVINASDGARGGCSDQVDSLELVDATGRYFFPSWAVQARPTDAQWDRIRSEIQPLLQEGNFNAVTMDAQIGTTRNLAVTDDLGAELSLGYNKAISLSLVSGCHLKEK